MLKRMLARAVGAQEETRLAETAPEREAIARLRYEIFVTEQGDAPADADHRTRTIWGPRDELPDTLHFYSRSGDRMRGSLRVRCWGAGALPEDLRRKYHTAYVPGADAVAGCETTGLVFRRDLRGTASVPALTAAAVRRTVEHCGASLAFASCSPGHLPAYRGLGFRAYAAPPIEDSFNLQLPLVGASFDLEHLRRCGSPWYRPLRALDGLGALPPAGPPELVAFLESRESVVFEAPQIAPLVDAAISQRPSSPLSWLSRRTRAHLARSGFVMDAPTGSTVVRAGTLDREMFFVLSGAFEVEAPGHQRAACAAGDLFGALGFLRPDGRRVATVRAALSGRLLVVRRRFLARLREQDPAAAVELYDALARLMVSRGAFIGA